MISWEKCKRRRWPMAGAFMFGGGCVKAHGQTIVSTARAFGESRHLHCSHQNCKKGATVTNISVVPFFHLCETHLFQWDLEQSGVPVEQAIRGAETFDKLTYAESITQDQIRRQRDPARKQLLLDTVDEIPALRQTVRKFADRLVVNE